MHKIDNRVFFLRIVKIVRRQEYTIVPCLSENPAIMPRVNNGDAVRILSIAVKDRRQQNEQNNNEYSYHGFRKLNIQGIQFFNTIKFPDSMNELLTRVCERSQECSPGVYQK